MHTRSSRFVSAVLAGALAWASLGFAAELKSIRLPEPQTDGVRPLMLALKNRQTQREFSAKDLSEPVLSNLLWAAWGTNRPESGKRTAPSAMDKQEVDVYVTTGDGVYLYDAKAHELKQILAEDLRAPTGDEEFVTTAPVSLIYVWDVARGVRNEEEAAFYAAITTGAIVQNVYLFSASEGLATVVRVVPDGPALAEAMRLQDDQRVLIAQTVGYPAE